MAKIYIRLLVVLWFLSIVMVAGILNISNQMPAPVVEWETIQAYLHDTRTGINYPVAKSAVNAVNQNLFRVRVIESPGGQYRMTVTRNDDGLDLRISDASGQIINSMRSTTDVSIANVSWLSETDLLLIQTQLASNDWEILRFNTLTSEQYLISNYDGGYFDISPGNNWLVLGDSTRGEMSVQSLHDERQYTINSIYTIDEWTGDEGYLASYIRIEGELALQILDTDTGQLTTENIAPEQLLWSGNNDYLLVQTETGIVIFHGTEMIAEYPVDSPILAIEWLPDGRQLMLITAGNGENQLHVVDVSDDTPLRLLTTIPDDTHINSIRPGVNSEVITYVLNSVDHSFSLIYRVRIRDGNTRLLTRIPAHISRVNYFDSVEIYGGLSPD